MPPRRALALGNHLRRRPIGAVFAAPFDVVLSPLDVVEPDLLSVTLAEVFASPI